jgi:uncharacterized protein
MSKADHQKQENRRPDSAQIAWEERLKADLRIAMKARQNSTVITIRSMLAAIDNAGAVELDDSIKPAIGTSGDVPRRILNEEQVRELLHKEAENRRSAIVTYERLGRQEDADRLRAELAVFARYLDDLASD